MNESKPPGRALRRTGAVLAGIVVITVLSLGTDEVMRALGVFPALGKVMSDGLFLLATAYRTVYSVAGCYLTARLAPDRPMQYALGLGAVGLVLNILAALGTWSRGPEFGPHWYPLALAALSIPSGWAGGKIHEIRSQPSAAS